MFKLMEKTAENNNSSNVIDAWKRFHCSYIGGAFYDKNQ